MPIAITAPTPPYSASMQVYHIYSIIECLDFEQLVYLQLLKLYYHSSKIEINTLTQNVQLLRFCTEIGLPCLNFLVAYG